jgi:hypothetical protein
VSLSFSTTRIERPSLRERCFTEDRPGRVESRVMWLIDCDRCNRNKRKERGGSFLRPFAVLFILDSLPATRGVRGAEGEQCNFRWRWRPLETRLKRVYYISKQENSCGQWQRYSLQACIYRIIWSNNVTEIGNYIKLVNASAWDAVSTLSCRLWATFEQNANVTVVQVFFNISVVTVLRPNGNKVSYSYSWCRPWTRP